MQATLPSLYAGLKVLDGLQTLLGLGVLLMAVVFFGVWIYRLHVDLGDHFKGYPTTPRRALAQSLIPIYFVWGLPQTFRTLAGRLKLEDENYATVSNELGKWAQWLATVMGANIVLVGIGRQWLVNQAVLNGALYYLLSTSIGLVQAIVWLRIAQIVSRVVAGWEPAATPGQPAAETPSIVAPGRDLVALGIIAVSSIVGVVVAVEGGWLVGSATYQQNPHGGVSEATLAVLFAYVGCFAGLVIGPAVGVLLNVLRLRWRQRQVLRIVVPLSVLTLLGICAASVTPSLAGLLATPQPETLTASGTTWSRTYSGNGNGILRSIAPMSDGGYIAAGEIDFSGSGNFDAWVVRLDSSGNVLWQKAYDLGENESARAIATTPDGGIVLAGYMRPSTASTNNQHAWVLRLDQAGNIVWQFSDSGNVQSSLESIVRTDQDSYVVAGAVQSPSGGDWNAWVVKFYSSGQMQWQQNYGGSGNDFADYIAATRDGGFVVAGRSQSFSNTYAGWAFKLNRIGTVEWSQMSVGDSAREAKMIAQTDDNGFIVIGTTVPQGPGKENGWMTKMDASGHVLWQKQYGNGLHDFAESVVIAPGEAYVFAGYMGIGGEGGTRQTDDAWLEKVDSSGNILWTKLYGLDGNDDPVRLAVAADGGFVLAGQTNSFTSGKRDAWVLKLDAEGRLGGSCPRLFVRTPLVDVSNASGAAQDASVTSSTSSINASSSRAQVRETQVQVSEQCGSHGAVPAEPTGTGTPK
jgi:hypothetical protein